MDFEQNMWAGLGVLPAFDNIRVQNNAKVIQIQSQSWKKKTKIANFFWCGKNEISNNTIGAGEEREYSKTQY